MVCTRGGARWVRRSVLAGSVALCVAVVSGVAVASSSGTSEGIVPLTPSKLLTSSLGLAVGAGKSVQYVVSGGATRVPTDADRVEFLVTVSKQQKAGSLAAQPYLDAADASGDSVSWAAPSTAVSDTVIEPVGVSNKVTFTNTSAGSISVVIKIVGYSTGARLAGRLDAAEARIASLEAANSALQGQVNGLSSKLDALTSRLDADEAALGNPGTLTLSVTTSDYHGQSGAATFYAVDVEGHGLKPLSPVTVHEMTQGLVGPPGPYTGTFGYVFKDGSYTAKFLSACTNSQMSFTGLDYFGAPVSTQTVPIGPGC